MGKYKYALVLWYADERWSSEDYVSVELLAGLGNYWVKGEDYELLCEGQPRSVLDKMRQLANKPIVRVRV